MLFPQNKKTDDRGFTLIEVLIAVLILAIVVGTVLHAFITSSNTAAKSQKLGDATLAAESIAETLEATNVSKLQSLSVQGHGTTDFSALSVADDESEAAYTGTGNADKYTFRLSGLTFGKHDFDAVVTLDATVYADVNSASFTQYNPMDAAFIQSSTLYENPDWMAADAMANTAFSLMGTETMGGVTYSSDYVLAHMTRTITLDLTQSDSGKYSAKVEYAYAFPLTYTLTTIDASGTEKTTTYTETLTESYSYEFYRDSEVMSSVYLFFYPNYNSTPLSPDRIIINNLKDLPVSLFLVKLKAVTRTAALDGSFTGVEQMSDSAILIADSTYNAYIAQWESMSSAIPAFATLYSNIGLQITNESAPNTAIATLNYEIYRGSIWYVHGTIAGDLTTESPVNRMYGVTIEIYDAGEATDPVYTFTSSKLD